MKNVHSFAISYHLPRTGSHLIWSVFFFWNNITRLVNYLGEDSKTTCWGPASSEQQTAKLSDVFPSNVRLLTGHFHLSTAGHWWKTRYSIIYTGKHYKGVCQKGYFEAILYLNQIFHVVSLCFSNRCFSI